MSYLTMESALARAKARSGAADQDEAFLIELLTLSAGADQYAIVHYRPFYVAAVFMEQNQSAQTPLESDEIKLAGLADPIASSYRLQATYDIVHALTIPSGFEIPALQSLGESTSVKP